MLWHSLSHRPYTLSEKKSKDISILRKFTYKSKENISNSLGVAPLVHARLQVGKKFVVVVENYTNSVRKHCLDVLFTENRLLEFEGSIERIIEDSNENIQILHISSFSL